MKALLFFSVVTHLIFTILLSLLLPDASIIAGILFLYIFPSILNGMLSLLYAQKNNHYITHFIFPTLSLCYYIITSFIIMRNGSWQQFATYNSIVDDGIYVEVASNLLSFGQIVFVGILFFGITTILLLILRRLRHGIKS